MIIFSWMGTCLGDAINGVLSIRRLPWFFFKKGNVGCYRLITDFDFARNYVGFGTDCSSFNEFSDSESSLSLPLLKTDLSIVYLSC